MPRSEEKEREGGVDQVTSGRPQPQQIQAPSQGASNDAFLPNTP
jgi:hypothetical protein